MWHGTLDDSSHTCACGRVFDSDGALNYHRRSCPSNKKRLASALAAARELWTSNKKIKLESDREGAGAAPAVVSTSRGPQ